MELEKRIEQLQKLIDEASHIAFFGGAGVSTESGIPDFRSKDGLYNQHDVQFEAYAPEYLLSHDCLMDQPKVFYEYYRQKMDCRTIMPNITHLKLAQLEEAGKRVSVITQNIDGLHQKAGSKEVYELHGSTWRNYCTHCKMEHASNAIFDAKEQVPICPHCKTGMIRPEVTLYGEQLPEDFTRALQILQKADLLIVAGTSLTVYPAATLVQYYQGGAMVVMNRDATSADASADLIFHENMGSIFAKIVS